MKFIFAILIFIGFNASAQQQNRVIFLIQGKLYLKVPGKQMVALKPLQLVNAKDHIKLGPDTASILFLNLDQGQAFEIKANGIYPLTELKKKEHEKGPGITAKFGHFLYEELLHPSKSPGKFSKDALAASWGAGSRSGCDYTKTPVGSFTTSQDTVVFRWKAVKGVASRFLLYDRDGEAILNLVVRDSQLVVNTSPYRKSEKVKLFWSASALDTKCSAIAKTELILVSVEYEEQAVAELIAKIPVQENKLAYNLAVADELGKNGFMEKAGKYYEKALYFLK